MALIRLHIYPFLKYQCNRNFKSFLKKKDLEKMVAEIVPYLLIGFL